MTETAELQSHEERFKMGMQLLAATVTLITSSLDGRRAGMVATAVSSLTVDPPSLLICTNRTSRTYGFIMDSRKFAVNLVPDTLPQIVTAFAAKGDKEEQFRAVGTWISSKNGMPVLEEAVASFSCQVDNWANTKTHAVFFGMVEDVRLHSEASPLIFARKSFHRIEPINTPGW